MQSMEERFRSLFNESGHKYHDVSVKLLQTGSEAKARADLSIKNKRIVEEQKEKLSELREHYATLLKISEVLKKWKTDLEDYNKEKMVSGLRNIENIMELAKNVVPNSMKDMKLKIDGRRAYIVSGNEYDISAMEGSGVLGIISMMLCRMIIKSSPDIIQFMILDEPLSKISEDTADILSSYMPFISNGMQIMWIEHKSSLFKNIEGITTYEFMLNEKEESIVNRI